MEVKKASIDDVEKILLLNQMLFDYEFKNFDDSLDTSWPPNNKEYFKKSVESDDSLALLAFDNGGVVGYFVGAIVKTEDYRKIKFVAEAENMFVLPEYRNKGIGKMFFEEFFSWIKGKEDISNVRVVVSAKNLDAINFYKKLGFVDYNIILEKSS